MQTFQNEVPSFSVFREDAIWFPAGKTTLMAVSPSFAIISSNSSEVYVATSDSDLS